MEKSKVFFTDLRTTPGNDILTKLERLVRKAGISEIDFDGKFTAIKIHFGEPGNMAYIRPNYAARIVDVIRSLGGKPFLTDSNTLYSGGRSNAVDHLHAAMENGFGGLGIGEWTKPNGGYFISFDGLPGTAKRTVQLCAEAGVALTPAGAAFPYGLDPEDKNIRIAPSLPPVEELKAAMEVFCVSLRLAALEQLLAK